MDIWSIDKLLLFLAFVIPGFITQKTYELLHPGILKDSSKQVIDAIAYSCFNYAILLWPIQAVEKSGLRTACPNIYSAFYLFVFLIAPILWAFIWAGIRKMQFIQNKVPHPTHSSWDYVFSKRVPYWVKITLKNGTVIGGLYSSNSFASSPPVKEQIYLEESWIINEKGGLERAKNDTSGILVLSTEIEFIEFMKYSKEE